MSKSNKNSITLEAALADSGIAIENLRTQIAAKAAEVAKLTTPADGTSACPSWSVWVRDIVAPAHEVGETWCAIVSGCDGKVYELDFSIEAGAVKIVGEPREVIANVEYVPAAAEAQHAGNPAAGELQASEQPRKDDGKYHGAAAATKEAFECSGNCKTKTDHEQAAELHDKAAALHKDAGDLAMAKQHKEKAAAHRATATGMTAEAQDGGRACEFTAEVMSMDGADAAKVFDGFMAMAGGVQTMTLGYCGCPITATIDVNADSARALQAQMEAISASSQQRPFNCFFHEKKTASSWPKKFFWVDGSDGRPAGIYEAAEPSADGLKAVAGKGCRGFSLTFQTNVEPVALPLEAGWMIPPGEPGSPANPAKIVCPPDVRKNPEKYLNMGTLTNRPASVKNKPLFASQDAMTKKNPPAPVAPARAGAHSSTHQNAKNKMIELNAEALQARNEQLEQRIKELEAQDTVVAKAQLEAAQAELRENNTKLELAKERAKTATFEAERKEQIKTLATAAVHDMIESQQIPALDREMQASFQAKFEADPELIPLIVKKSVGGRRHTPGANAVELSAARMDVEVGWNIPTTEMKQMLNLCNQNARIRIHPGMTKSELTAAYEDKGRLAMQAGLHYKKKLAPHFDEWGNIPPPELAKCIGLDASQLGKPNIRELTAGDYTDPNNQFQTLSGTLVLQRTLPYFALEYPELLAMFTDFSDEPGLYEQTEKSRVVNIPAVQKYNAGLDGNGFPIGFQTASAASTVDAPITLTDYIAVPIAIGVGTLTSTTRRLVDETAPQAIKAIAGYFTGMMTALITAGNYNAYGVVTGPNAQGVVLVPVAYATYAKSLQDWSMTDLDKLSAIFTQNQVPRGNRGILLSTQYYAKLRSDPRLEWFFAASKGDPQLTQQKLPDGLSGFFPYEAPYLPAANNLQFFPFHKAGIMLKSRLPASFSQAVDTTIPGSITTVTDPDTKISLALVQYVDLLRSLALWRPEGILGASVGDNRGGLCGTSQ